MTEKNMELQKSESPTELMKLAIEKGTDLDKLEKFLTLQQRWEENEAKKAYHLAMSKFKASPPRITKDKKVSFGAGKASYNHASLYNVVNKISSELSKHGLSAAWSTKQNGNILVTCKITHERGHGEETTLQAPADGSGSKNAIQAIGSTVTYLERYTLLALTGLATSEQDDDAQVATTDCIDDKQQKEIKDLLKKANAEEDMFCTAFGIETISQLPKDRYAQAIKSIKAKGTK